MAGYPQHVGTLAKGMRADVLVLSDTANLATGLPSITTSLRGLLNVDVRLHRRHGDLPFGCL